MARTAFAALARMENVEALGIISACGDAEEIGAAFQVLDLNEFVAGVGLFDSAWADGDGGGVLFGEEGGIAEPRDTDTLGAKGNEFFDDGVRRVSVKGVGDFQGSSLYVGESVSEERLDR